MSAIMSMGRTLHAILVLLFRIARRGVVCTILAKIVNSLYPAFFTEVFIRLIEVITEGGNTAELGLLAGTVVMLILADALLQAVNQIALNGWLFETSNLHLRGVLTTKIAQLSPICLEDSAMLDEIQLMKDVIEDETIPLTLYELLETGGACLTFVSLAFVLFRFHPALVGLLLITMIPVLLSRFLRGRDMFRLRRRQIPETRRLSLWRSWFTNDRENRELRATNAQGYVLDLWSAIDKKHRNEVEMLEKKDTHILAVCEILRVAALVVAIGFSVLWVTGEVISLGVLGGAILAFSQSQSAATEFFRHMGSLPRLLSEDEKVLEFLAMEKEQTGQMSIETIESMCFRDVSFTYPHTLQPSLRHVDFVIKAGECVALVGLNGSGKTTLTKVLLGIYSPSEGDVMANDTSLLDIHKQSLYGRVGHVPQVIPRIEGISLREYMCLGHSLSDEILSSCLAKVGLASLAESLDKMLGKEFSGLELSTGMLQRLAIAKCLLHESDLYVLDEPTSAIDPLEEGNILRLFLDMATNKACLIVTHRLSICPYVDSILVIDEGQIIESGTHETLMRSGGVYADMYAQQRAQLLPVVSEE